MSVTFYAAKQHEDGSIRFLYRCDCDEQYNHAYDMADKHGSTPPDITQFSCEICRAELNVTNDNARELLAWLGVSSDLCGHIKATELAVKCRRRLWPEARNYDPAIPPIDTNCGVTGMCLCAEGRNPVPHARVIYGGRGPGYLRDKTEVLLRIAELAGENLVAWA